MNIRTRPNTSVDLAGAVWTNAHQVIALHQLHPWNVYAQGGEFGITPATTMGDDAVNARPELGVAFATGRTNEGRNAHLLVAVRAAVEYAVEARIGKSA